MQEPVKTHTTESVRPDPDPAPAPPAPSLDRRALLRLSALMGGAAVLAGCAGRSRVNIALPGPVWPHQEPQRVIAPPRPAPQIALTDPVPPQAAPTAGVPAYSTRVLPRIAWTRGQPRWQFSRPMNGVSRITVHHDANNAAGLTGQAAVKHRLNSIRDAHMRRGSTWVDIGYHYIIDPDGRVWEGRPLNIEGAHVASTNDHNLGVMLLGNFEQHRPTGAQLSVLDLFLAEQMQTHRVPLSRVFTHKELKPTECPGVHLQSYMKQTRSGRGRLAMMA